MTPVLPPPRKIPVVPRPRHGELSGSYLARVARANRTDLRSFLSLLGSLPSALLEREPGPGGHGAHAERGRVQQAARLHRPGRRAAHQGDPVTSAQGDLPARRASRDTPLVREDTGGRLPGCRLRRDGAHADTRLLAHKTACLRHGYWLFGQGGGQRLNLTAIPEVAAAQRRLDRIASRRGPTAAMRAYEIASGYLQHSWRIDSPPVVVPRPGWNAGSSGSAQQALCPPSTTWQLPGWAVHPECTALAAVFASPYWAALAVPVAGPTPPTLLPASARRTRPRRRRVPADHEDLRSPAARHPGTGPVGPSPERPGLGRTSSGGWHREGDPLHRHHRRLRTINPTSLNYCLLRGGNRQVLDSLAASPHRKCLSSGLAVVCGASGVAWFVREKLVYDRVMLLEKHKLARTENFG